jgi:LEA14-like dessication related protein
LIGQGRGIIYVAMAGLLAMLGGITWYASLDNPQLSMAEIQLTSVKVVNTNTIDNQATLEVSFLIKNPGGKTFTVSNIDYELFANGKSLGRGSYSTEDIALPGRAGFYPGSQIELPTIFHLVLSDNTADEYNSIINGQELKFNAKGKMVVESAWSLVEKNFETSQ